MVEYEPAVELHPQFSSEGATPAPWKEALEHLKRAEVYWLSTVRPDGRPHVTPVISVWLDGACYFCTGPGERKAKNLMGNRQCILTTGRNTLSEGLDLVIEGEAANVSDQVKLQRVAEAYESKYGSGWRFAVRDGAFHGDAGNIALVYEVAPATIFTFGKGDLFCQTRWRFFGGRWHAEKLTEILIAT